MGNFLYRHQTCYGVDLDYLLAYPTPRVELIKDRTLGFINYCVQLIIWLYIFVVIIYYNQEYKVKFPPTGTANANIRAPAKIRPKIDLPYCADPTPGREEIAFQRIPCTEINEIAIQTSFPNEFNILTRLNLSFIREEDRTENLEQFMGAFVQDIESHTLKIDHQFQVTPLEHRDVDSDGVNQEFDGHLEDREGKVIQDFKSRFDIVTLGTLLKAAGVGLDDIDARSGETMRYSGAQIIFFIKYVQNRNSGEIHYEYRLKKVMHAEHKRLSLRYYNATHHILENRHSISLKFVADGLLGVFDFFQLMLCLVSSLSLLVLATTVTEYLMIYCLPLSKEFTDQKYGSDGPDFSTLRAEKGLDCCGVRKKKNICYRMGICECCQIKKNFYNVEDEEEVESGKSSELTVKREEKKVQRARRKKSAAI